MAMYSGDMSIRTEGVINPSMHPSKAKAPKFGRKQYKSTFANGHDNPANNQVKAAMGHAASKGKSSKIKMHKPPKGDNSFWHNERHSNPYHRASN